MRELDWFDGPEADDDPPRRRPRWFPALIAVPWVVVAALLVLPRVDAAEQATSSDHPEPGAGEASVGPEPTQAPLTVAPEGPEAAGSTDATSAPLPPAGAGSTPIPEVLEVRELRGQWRVAPGSEEAASLALVVARAWLTGVGPPLLVPGITPRGGAYAEHLVVEATERTSADTEVVTVLAMTLRDVEGATPSTAVERLAVPIAWDEHGPRPAGPPWPLPGPRLDPLTPTLLPVEDDETAWDDATSALAHAGLGTYRLEALHQAPDGPLVATISDAQDRHDVWLRAHLGGYVVAGATVRATPDQEPAAEDRP